MKKKSDFKVNTVRRYGVTHMVACYNRDSVAQAAVTRPTERNFSEWYLKRFSMGWVDHTTAAEPTTAFISYNTVVGNVYHNKATTLIDSRDYSRTTSRHKWALHRASLDTSYLVLVVPDVFYPTSHTNAGHYITNMTNTLADMKNNRRRAYNRLHSEHTFEDHKHAYMLHTGAFGPFSPEQTAKIDSLLQECIRWVESDSRAVLVAKCALDGMFFD
jgi:hypothetical protein